MAQAHRGRAGTSSAPRCELAARSAPKFVNLPFAKGRRDMAQFPQKRPLILQNCAVERATSQ